MSRANKKYYLYEPELPKMKIKNRKIYRSGVGKIPIQDTEIFRPSNTNINRTN